MRVVICGSRNITNYDLLNQVIEDSEFNITSVISGCARGVDKLGEEWARKHNIEVFRVPANWEMFGKSAGIIRNKMMIKGCDAVIALWDGKSRGTKHAIDYAYSLSKPIHLATFPNLF